MSNFMNSIFGRRNNRRRNNNNNNNNNNNRNNKKYNSGMLGGGSSGGGSSGGAFSRGGGSNGPTMYVAQYDFQADTREELSVKKGEQMELVKKLDDSWAEVRIGRSKGLVPLSYIKKIEGGGGRKVPPAPQSRSAAPRVEQYIALYDFTAQSRDELSIREGEKMEMVKIIDTDWCEVAIGRERGIVPRNYIQRC